MKKCGMIAKAGYLLAMDDNFTILRNGAIAYTEGRIDAVGPGESIAAGFEAKEVMEFGNAVIMPGLVNAHVHAAMSYFRGIADDMPLEHWLQGRIWPAENKFVDPEFIHKGSELACLEMIKSGTTAFADMYFFENVLAQVVEKAGLRALIGEAILDFKTPSAKSPDEAVARTLEYKAAFAENEFIKVALAPHSTLTCSKDLLKVVYELSKAHDLPIMIHVSETVREMNESTAKFAQSPVGFLDSLGLFDGQVLAAHCVHLSEDDIAILKERSVNIAHNPISNLKLGSGIAPIAKLLEAGAKLSLGTDGAASNNTLDIWSEIRTAALIHKGVSGDPAVANAKEVIRMATAGGARAIGMDRDTGSLEAGKSADFIVVGLDKPHLTPLYDIYSHLAYAAGPADVDAVIVNGRVLMRGREVKTMDEEKILAEANGWKESITV
jgi:5-methylthioadenosine/S-adenosylhomocysteine deaminase